jgi:biotin carboxylase
MMARILLLLPTTTYRTKAYIEAALKIHADIVAASEQPSTMQHNNPAGLLTLDFLHPTRAAQQAEEFAAHYHIDAVIPVDENTAVVAAHIAEALGLQHNSISSTIIARNKHLMRETLSRAGVPVPRFWHFTLDEEPLAVAKRINYPCVVKPVALSTSRGVMRANNETEFLAAAKRLDTIVSKPDVARRLAEAAREALVEEFISGFEIALEGLVTNGELRILAIFDKPDPLDGPFFEETIYVTPSRLPHPTQRQIRETTQAAVRAMGLTRGPIHAELRINQQGPWVIEVAARAIGGLCSRTLRFDRGMSLEELILRHAVGQDVARVELESTAAGVMMIPIPKAGILKEVKGVADAMRVPDIEDIAITAHTTQELLPPPEGASYLGFIFSRAESPERAEAALRETHRRIEFVIEG